MVHLQEGTRLTGEDAPTRKDLAHWLEEHPGYVEEKPPTLPDAGDKAEVGGLEGTGHSSFVTLQTFLGKLLFLGDPMYSGDV